MKWSQLEHFERLERMNHHLVSIYVLPFFFLLLISENVGKKKKSLISSAGILSIVCKVQHRCNVSGAYLCNMLTARDDVIYLPGPLSLAKIIISCIRSQQSLEKINI